MYTPAAFQETNDAKLRNFIKDNSFATLITYNANQLETSHLILLPDEKHNNSLILQGHLARVNPQIQHLQNNPKALAIFLGAHTYISPAWYKNPISVPTWNYTAVHVHGTIKPITDKTTLKNLLDRLVAKYESSRQTPWQVPWTEQTIDTMLDMIVGFELHVERVEGKFKLSQNRSVIDQQNVIHELENSSDAMANAVAKLMRGNL